MYKKLMIFTLVFFFMLAVNVFAQKAEAPPAATAPAAPVATAPPAAPAATTPAAPVAPAVPAVTAPTPPAATAPEQTGNKIVGTYEYKDNDNVTQEGKIEGLVEDNKVKAKWYERPKVGSGAENRGDLEWKIADKGKMLAGWYRNEGEKEQKDWNLER